MQNHDPNASNDSSDDSIDLLLARYYAAEGPHSLRLAQRLESELIACIRPFLIRCLRLDGANSEEAEDYCQQALSIIVVALRASRQHSRIVYFKRWAASIAINVVREAKRKDTPRRVMAQALRYILIKSKYSEHFARWEYETIVIIGLSSQHGMPFAQTTRYLAFCRDDTAFIQCLLGEQNAANNKTVNNKKVGLHDIGLYKLLFQLLEWIETPLPQSLLIEHMLQLRPITQQQTEALDDVAEHHYHAPNLPEMSLFGTEADFDWTHCWDVICGLSPLMRATLLLKMTPRLLAIVSCQTEPRPQIAALLAIETEEMERLWQKLPLTDDDIAEYCKTTKNNVQKTRFLCPLQEFGRE